MLSQRAAKRAFLCFVDKETKLKGRNRVMEVRGGRGSSMVQGGALVNGDGSARSISGASNVEVEEETAGSIVSSGSAWHCLMNT